MSAFLWLKLKLDQMLRIWWWELYIDSFEQLKKSWMFAFQYMSVMEVVSSVKNSGGANGEPADGMSPFETGKRVR